MKRFFAVLLSFFCMTASVLPCFAAAERLDGLIYRSAQTLSDGLVYEQFLSDTEVMQHGYVFTYTPGKDVLPLVAVGDGIYGRTVVSAIAEKQAEAGTGTVLGAVNGDFFSMKTGIPMGVMIADGKILSGDAAQNAFGIKADGSYIIGCPKISVCLTAKGQTVSVSHINKYPSVWGSYLCTPAYGKTTESTEESREYVFHTDSGEFSLTDTVSATLTEIRLQKTDGDIPEDGFVIVVSEAYTKAADFAFLEVGDTAVIACRAEAGWEDVTFAVGGGDVLVKDGVPVTDTADEEHEKTANPRTAVGYTADGEMIVFALDGRREDRYGMRLVTLAKTMAQLGCVGAVNLDGGGSTTVLVRERDGALVLANKPTDGNERAVSNAILFVNPHTADGIPAGVTLTPETALVLRDAPVKLTTALVDHSYAVLPTEGDGAQAEITEITYETTAGVVSGDGILSGLAAGECAVVTATVTVLYENEEKTFTASATVQSVDTVSAMVYDTNVYGLWNGMTVSLSGEQRASMVFSDIADSWAREEIVAAYCRGLVAGNRSGGDALPVFRPTDTVTRAEFAKMLSVLCELPLSDTVKREDLPYADAAEIADWAIPYVKAVTDAGLLHGKQLSEDKVVFAGTDTMTRAEVMQILGSLLTVSADTAVLSFSDADTVPDWAYVNTQKSVAAGLVTGFPDGTLRPFAGVTRAEAVVLLLRMDTFLSNES